MSSFFNMDNKFFTTMSRVGDLMILNLLTILLCIPVVTIGPAVTAMFSVCLKMVRNEESYIVKGYFHSFKLNLKQGIIINIILLLAAALLYMDFFIVNNGLTGNTQTVMFFLMMFILMIYLMVFMYIYPVLAKFVNTVKNTFVNAFLMSLRHLPYTFLMIVITALPFVLFFFGNETVQSVVLLVSMMVGFSGVAFINSFFLMKIFDNYIPKEEDAPSDLDFTVPVEEETTPSGSGEESGSHE